MTDAAIQCVGVSHNFNANGVGAQVLDNVSLTIAAHEMVAITGPSGSGKTTLLSLIGCLLIASKGDIRIFNKPVSHMTPTQLAKLRSQHIGFVFQQFNLLPRVTAIDNVMLPLMYSSKPVDNAKERAAQALDTVGLGQHLLHKPSQLSGGEQQRVAIARALINNPDIVLADEPTGALDAETGSHIMDLFCDLHRSGITVIVVTHDASVSNRTQRILRVVDGRLLAGQ